MRRLQEASERGFDLVIIGGGIVGAGIARDAAMRGLSTALFEKEDFGGGTTAGSTRLIHGGLRYLEMFDFGLVRLDLKERETLLRIAPHLVKPLEFLVPFYDEGLFNRLKIKAGMVLYDFLSFDKSLPRHRFMNAEEALAQEPHLRREGLRGAASFYDAQAYSPERLCIENLIDARKQGAIVYNYAEVTGALREGAAVVGVRVRDALDAGAPEIKVRARVVINASGPWFDGVNGRLTGAPARRIRTTKGIHVTCPQMINRAMALTSPIDGRLFFVIPWLGYSWIGTTDTDFPDDPGQARATCDDVDYIIRSAQAYFPEMDPDCVIFSNAGVRALVMAEGSESSVSRMHRIVDGAAEGAPGLISVLGGKLTGYRAVAEEATDMACRRLGTKQQCATAATPLPGACNAGVESAAPPGVDAETADHLRGLYGARAGEVLQLAADDDRLRGRLTAHAPDIAAQVVFAVRNEQCVRAADFIWRRTLLGFSRDQGRSALASIAELMAEELRWSPAQKAAEIAACRRILDRTQAFRTETEEIGSAAGVLR
jgi:glycerol-3-phosphate dehydrogenase